MADIFMFFVMLVIMAGLGLIVYKYRRTIKRWMHDEKYGSTWHPSRETILKREIEDANAELTAINDRKAEQEGGDA